MNKPFTGKSKTELGMPIGFVTDKRGNEVRVHLLSYTNDYPSRCERRKTAKDMVPKFNNRKLTLGRINEIRTRFADESGKFILPRPWLPQVSFGNLEEK